MSAFDPSFARVDTITSISVANIVQGVLTAYGAAAVSIAFGLGVSSFQSSYTVGQGEKTKLAEIAYG